jgi:hypothetical protein
MPVHTYTHFMHVHAHTYTHKNAHTLQVASTPAAAAAANMYGGGAGGSQGMALPYSGNSSVAATLYTNPPAPTAYASQVSLVASVCASEHAYVPGLFSSFYGSKGLIKFAKVIALRPLACLSSSMCNLDNG